MKLNKIFRRHPNEILDLQASFIEFHPMWSSYFLTLKVPFLFLSPYQFLSLTLTSNSGSPSFTLVHITDSIEVPFSGFSSFQISDSANTNTHYTGYRTLSLRLIQLKYSISLLISDDQITSYPSILFDHIRQSQI